MSFQPVYYLPFYQILSTWDKSLWEFWELWGHILSLFCPLSDSWNVRVWWFWLPIYIANMERKSNTLECFRNEPLLGKFLSKWKRHWPITSHINIHHTLQGHIMTLNSLDSSTVFSYQNETATIPGGHAAPASDRNQATMDTDQIAPVQAGHLPVT